MLDLNCKWDGMVIWDLGLMVEVQRIIDELGFRDLWTSLDFLNVVLGSVVISSVAPIEDASVRHHTFRHM